MEDLGLYPTSNPTHETIHIAHVLSQLVKGYLTGSNDVSKWKHNAFANVRCVFYLHAISVSWGQNVY